MIKKIKHIWKYLTDWRYRYERRKQRYFDDWDNFVH
jgi:hypothetical protein